MSTYAIARGRLDTPLGVRARQTFAGLFVGALTAALTVSLATQSAVKGAAILITIGGVVWFATTTRTTLALALLLLYLGLIDGYLKLSTGSNLVTFVRDLLLYAIALGVLVRAVIQRRRLAVPPLGGWVLAFVLFTFIQLANPHDGSLYHSLAGVRQHLEFVPLFFLTFAFVRTTKALRWFVLLLVVVAAANGVADYVQFHLTPAQFAAWGPGYSQRVLGTGGSFQFGGRVFTTATGTVQTRPFGLLSDAGAGGLACGIGLAGILALISIPGKRRYMALAGLAAVLAVVGVLTSQGRASLVASVVVVLAYAMLSFTSRRALATVVVVSAAALIAFVTVKVVESSQTQAFRYKGVTSTQILSVTSQARGRSIARIPHNLVTYPLGAGLGVAGPATDVRGAPPQAGHIDAETEFSFATVETGIPGLVVLVGFPLVLFALGLRRCRSEPDPEARVLLAALAAPVAGMLALYWVGAVTPTTPYGPYLWAVGGVISYWLIAKPAQDRKDPGAFLGV